MPMNQDERIEQHKLRENLREQGRYIERMETKLEDARIALKLVTLATSLSEAHVAARKGLEDIK